MRRNAPHWTDHLRKLLLIAAVALATAAGAQVPIPGTGQAPAPSAPPLPAVPTTLDSAIVVVQMREPEAIERDLEEATARKSSVEQRIDQARDLQARAEAAIKIKDSEIRTIEAQLDLAKKMNDEMQKSDFEARKKLATLEKKLLQSRKKLRDQEISHGRAARDYYEEHARAFEQELELARMRDRRRDLGDRATTSPTLLTEAQGLDNQIRELERRTLDAQIRAADKRKAMAQQEADVAKARKAILESQIKLQRGG